MKKNILIIDDSALMRRLLSDIILSDNRFEVKDYACNGIDGLDILVKKSELYDAVLLDVNMPKMNGLEVLDKIQRYKIKCKVIMVSTLVKEDANETIMALERGAFDFILKPLSSKPEVRQAFRKNIIHSLEVATGINTDDFETDSKIDIKRNTEPYEKKRSLGGKKLVAIASSTGGPKSLKDVIPLLPKNLDAPVLIVQHMPAGFTASLAQRLDEISEVEVKEAMHGETLRKGVVYIAPGGKQFRLSQKNKTEVIVELTDEPPREGLKPCANIMYESIADIDYNDITCVVLTGMGSDGTRGIERLGMKKNLYVIAQNEATCVVYGMPRAIANAGLTDEILPLKNISGAIIKNVGVLNDGR